MELSTYSEADARSADQESPSCYGTRQLIALIRYRTVSILTLRSRYSAQHPVLKYPQSIYFPRGEIPSFTPM
jgi:hypothetical protein